ncbi:MAG: site-2 protease family protein, partial [Clostridia bacterium]|nr:site-2 protease family protein [Clostridia bacterium]
MVFSAQSFFSSMMNSSWFYILVTALATMLLFGFLIFIHEFGHYITARLFKVTVKEFSIGMGPKILQKRSKKTDIAYSLRALPIGGYVSMEGEDEESGDPNAFYKKAVWKRMIITAAGGVMNLLLGLILTFIYVLTSVGLAA